jgi:hypothetical protein
MRWKNNSSTADLLRPSKRQSLTILAHSRQRWATLLAAARSATRLPQSCSNICNLLNRTPSLPDEQKVEDVVEGAILSLEGYSQWKITSSRCCDLPLKLKTSPRQRVNIGVAHPTFCNISDEFLPAWIGFEHLPNCASGGNYLAAFVLGWSYILSARLIELRKRTEDDKIIYTDKKATYYCDDTALPCDGFSIPIGNADANECRWWSAILAGDCGWRAILNRSGGAYYPPWACHLNPKARLNIRYERTSHLSPSVTYPPSSGEAQQYLCNFARLHNAYDQLIAAFVAALTIPSHLRFGAPVTLPKPKLMTHSRGPGSICGTYVPSTDQLPHFMLLSCIPNVLPSCLFGCFWTPGVHCNVASEWLHPILREILPPLIQEKKYEVIIRMMAARQPSLAPLWLGSAITGILPRIQSILSSFMPPGCPEATVWTNCYQSFMDSAFHKELRISDNATLGKIICREDEFRLLYLTDIESDRYGMLPLSPYPPFGVVKLDETALEVRLHAFCGHQLDYSHWAWRNHDRPDLIDFGIPRLACPHSHEQGPSRKPIVITGICRLLARLQSKSYTFWHLLFGLLWPPGKALPCEKLSEIATRNIFSWTFFSDGVRPDEMAMWRHEWLSFLLDHESDDENTSVISSEEA